MTLLYALDLVGTAAFAASGAWAGIRRRMNLFGVMVLGLVTATGAVALLATIFRLLAIHFDWSLPRADDRAHR